MHSIIRLFKEVHVGIKGHHLEGISVVNSFPSVKFYAQEKITDSHFWVFKEYPQKSQIWKSETSPNLGTWLGIPWLGLVSLCQIWDFYGYSLNTQKYPKMGIRYFFLCAYSARNIFQKRQTRPLLLEICENFSRM